MRALCFLPLLLAGCAVIPGNYEGKSAERTVRVTLKPDGFAALSSAFTGRPSRFLAEGTWAEEGRRLRLKLEGETMEFERRGADLYPRDWDRARWGEQGPGILTKVF